ncbi:MAG: Helicase associated domain protein [Lachnospiraceae bacterium]|nr:Helicase associated domain protein [Lachnospiraceae bacterium]
MAITLYRHNQEAYEAAAAMLSAAGKAAVIHPTGTGKSFIGFRLCEDHPDSRVLWLSPSSYIFTTQLENLADASGGWQPENITFLTYARLINLTGEEIEELRPDYIILDEFHRCGARQWGQGVKRLLEQYPEVPLLGLSATAIRYLDNQRDMSDELFDGHIASTMTLGECIVRGILNPPVYVRSIYSYKGELERYERGVSRIRSGRRREQAELILEKLRRALDMAEGLDRVFDRRTTDRTGKYILFCSDYRALQEVKDKLGEWFGLIDRNPRVYTVYSDDPSASREFLDFKADETPDHLRLLLCIDALNEGVHVEDISGVILMRPTVSPIIYKQQIGRALSASKKTQPVIFDIVNNIENLYSIDTVREEMREAMDFLRQAPDQDSMTESFEVIDEVASCMELFHSLEDTLTASWDVMYREAEKYYEEHGDLMVPAVYITQNGYSLGRWIRTQRVNRKTGDPLLTDARIDALDKIGMNWGSVLHTRWMRIYRLAKDYYEEHGHLVVPNDYEINGQKLGTWISSQRESYKKGHLCAEQISLLEAIGMSWNRFESKWERGYSYCRRFVDEGGDINQVPSGLEYDGFRLLVWLRTQRSRKRAGKLSPERIRRLEELGLAWDVFEAFWEKGYAHACAYRRSHGNMKVPANYVCDDGFRLKGWLNNQSTRRKNGSLSPVQLEKLEAIGY